jgi:hypothetical protein
MGLLDKDDAFEGGAEVSCGSLFAEWDSYKVGAFPVDADLEWLWESSLSSSVSGRGRRRDLDEFSVSIAWWLFVIARRCGGLRQPGGKSRIAMGPSWWSLIESKLTVIFFLETVLERRRRIVPPAGTVGEEFDAILEV